MIIFSKLLKNFPLKKLEQKLGQNIVCEYLYKNKNIKLELITSKLNIKKIYSYRDFEKDFGEKYKKYIERKTVYNILMSGISVADFFKMNRNIRKQLYNGFIMESISFSQEQLPYISIDYNISNFEVAFFENHIELYGKKEELENFKIKFKIEQKILWEPYKETWHLAFSGLLAEKIRLDYKV